MLAFGRHAGGSGSLGMWVGVHESKQIDVATGAHIPQN